MGMGPPIFAKKPDIPPKRLSKSEEKPKEEKPAEDVLKEEKPVVVSPPAEGASEGEYLFLSIGVRRAGMTMFHLQVSPWRKLLLSSCPLLSQRARMKAQAVRTHGFDIGVRVTTSIYRVFPRAQELRCVLPPLSGVLGCPHPRTLSPHACSPSSQEGGTSTQATCQIAFPCTACAESRDAGEPVVYCQQG